MKKMICAALIALCFAACSKENEAVTPEKKQKVQLTLNVSPYHVETKNTGPNNANVAQFDSIWMMEVFVFREDGILEVYNKTNTNSPGGVKTREIMLTLTQGKKYIYAVANAKMSPWTGITTREQFLAQEVLLKTENFGRITMTAETEITLTDNTSMNLYLQKLLAKIRVTGIATDFGNGPYRDYALQNVKLYLVNVSGKKTYMGEEPPTPLVLNSGGYVAADNSGTAMPNIYYEPLTGDIDDHGNYTEHCFYCYENLLSEETSTKKYTRLVLEAQLNGQTFYYPVDINQPDNGWNTTINHRGVKRNTVYTVNFIISGPGAARPDDKVLLRSLIVNTYVTSWSTGVSYVASF